MTQLPASDPGTSASCAHRGGDFPSRKETYDKKENAVLDRDFASDAPMTDITYMRTYEGWLFLAAVMDLYSRQIVGWATSGTPGAAEYESPWELPRQCRGRELLQRTEEGKDQAVYLLDTNGGDIGCVRLHRDVLQPDSPA